MESLHIRSYTKDNVILGLFIEAFKCITHNKSEPYADYVVRVSKNPIAKQVKLADLKHNMDLTRIPKPTEIDLKRLEVKYKPALAFLKGEIEESEYIVPKGINAD